MFEIQRLINETNKVRICVNVSAADICNGRRSSRENLHPCRRWGIDPISISLEYF